MDLSKSNHASLPTDSDPFLSTPGGIPCTPTYRSYSRCSFAKLLWQECGTLSETDVGEENIPYHALHIYSAELD